MMSVDEALKAIPSRAGHLERIDSKISHVIRYVERVFTLLKVNTRHSIAYDTPDGRFLLIYGKHGGKWNILHTPESNDDPSRDMPLTNSPRHVRAEVFTVYEGQTQSPIELLIVAAVDALDAFAKERTPQLDRALTLANTLAAAGFPDEGGQ